MPGSNVVVAWLCMNGGGLLVPKYTSCDVASEPAVQFKSAVVLTPIALSAGLGLLARPG